MISLHRLGHQVDVFQLNPDLIMTVEATPDTVITLTNGTKIVVAEPPERVVADVRDHKIEILDGVSGTVLGLMVPLIAADLTQKTGHLNLAIGAFGLAVVLDEEIVGVVVERRDRPIGVRHAARMHPQRATRRVEIEHARGIEQVR